MTYPEWVEQYRETGKKIKQIHGWFYLYKHKTVWDKDREYPKKVADHILAELQRYDLQVNLVCAFS